MKTPTEFIALALLWILVPSTLVIVFGNIYAQKRITELKEKSSRSHDKYTLGENYMPNVDSKEVNIVGDLCSQAGYHSGEECPFWDGKRSHHFQSDKLGFKTAGNFDKSDTVLIGDSFLAAIGGDDTKDQLGAVLTRKTSKNIYEAAHPGGIDSYIKRHKRLTSLQTSPKQYIFLLFEGNDFYQTLAQSNKNKGAQSWQQKPWHMLRFIYSPIFNKLNSMPLAKLLITVNASKKLNPSNVVVKKINGRLQAFSIDYVQSSSKDSAIQSKEIEYFIKNKKSICALIIVPTASSIYLEKNNFQQRHPTLAGQIERIKNAKINVINLTETLKKQAKNENKNYRLWWSDDTHWNKNAINIAAEEIINSDLQCL